MEWDAPGVVLDVRPYGEGDAVATVMTEEQGAAPRPGPGRRLARKRGGVAARQPGAGALGRPAVRPAGQLRRRTDPSRRGARDGGPARRWRCSSAACAVAEGALPEREPHPRVFDGLLHLIAAPAAGRSAMLPDFIRWEAVLLAELGYGLDLARCAVTGATRRLRLRLAEDRPRGDGGRRRASGRRGCCRCRLPARRDSGAGGPGGDLARRAAPDRAFPGARRLRPSAPPLPLARQMLYDRVVGARRRLEQERSRPMPDDLIGDIQDTQLADALSRALPRLCAVHHHVALAAGCARRAEAGASPAALRHAPAAARSRPPASRNAPASSAT